ncbi:unnamed protein product, partial [Prorocentrum cordatum]
MAMWDPETASSYQLVCASSELPQDLQSCLDRLVKDKRSDNELKDYLKRARESDPVDAFCQKYKLGPK